MTIKVDNYYITTPVPEILQLLKFELGHSGKRRFATIKDNHYNVQTNCPFHKDGQEQNPSFGILKQDKGDVPAGSAHCFTCGYSADFPTFIGDLFGGGYQYGVEWLVGSGSIVNDRTKMSFDVSRSAPAKRYTFDENELQAYKLEKDPNNYLAGRGISEDVLEIFDVGYCKNFLGQGETVTFPVTNRSGETVFVAHRFINKKFFHYPEGAEKPVYALDKLTDFTGSVVVVESIIDCLTLWSWDIASVALNGTGSDTQYEELMKMPARAFYLAFDGDDAGKRADYRFRQKVKGKLISTIEIPLGKDVNDLSEDEFNSLNISL